MRKLDIQIDVQEKQSPGSGGKIIYDLSNLSEGKKVCVRAALLKVFEGQPFYSVCEQCGKSLVDGKCKDHENVDGEFRIVISGIIDDGKGNLRAVFFGENAEKIIGKDLKDAQKIYMQKGEKGFFKEIPLGREYIFSGNIRLNDFTKSLELNVVNVKNVNVEEEIKGLIL